MKRLKKSASVLILLFLLLLLIISISPSINIILHPLATSSATPTNTAPNTSQPYNISKDTHDHIFINGQNTHDHIFFTPTVSP
ncbi:MAG TPA: hypothetical protein VL461_02760 [Dictyobacter sp.]|nr:hypothetical protein [Dictyobacter sp.]